MTGLALSYDLQSDPEATTGTRRHTWNLHTKDHATLMDDEA